MTQHNRLTCINIREIKRETWQNKQLTLVLQQMTVQVLLLGGDLINDNANFTELYNALSTDGSNLSTTVLTIVDESSTESTSFLW